MEKRPWESTASFVANEILWHKVYSRWAGLAITATLGGIIGTFAQVIFRGHWLLGTLAGAIAGALMWVIIYLALWCMVAPRKQLQAAKIHIAKLERKPTVDIGLEVVREGSAWYLPIRNNGPGDVELYAGVTRFEYQDGSGEHERVNPIEYINWEGGRGHHPDGAPSWRILREGQMHRLQLFQITGSATLSNGQVGTEARLLAAHSGNNFQGGFVIGSDLLIEVQVFGKTPLAEWARNTIILRVPAYGGSEDA